MEEKIKKSKEKEIKELTKDRDYNIDLLKVLACVAVIGLHTLQKDISLLNATLYYLCGFAIPIFWMSSGAFLMNRGGVKLKYVLRKILHILIVVVVWNILIIIAQLTAKLILHTDYEFTILTIPKEVIKSLVQKGILFHFWYFGSMIIIYALLPLLVRFNDKQRKSLLLILGITAVALQIVSMLVGQPIQSYVIQTFRLWTWLFYFVAGGLLYQYLQKKSVNLLFASISFAAITVIVLIYQNLIGRYVILETSGVLHAEYFYDSILTIIWAISLFVFIKSIKLGYCFKNLISKVAPLTMGIYIIHPLIVKVYNYLIEVDTILDAFLMFAIVLVCSIIVTAVMKLIPIVKDLIKL